MHLFPKLILATLALTISGTAIAQSDDAEQLKIAALEALVSAPDEKALPIVSKVLAGDHSDEVKSRALFVLSQIDLPESQAILLDTARTAEGDLKHQAIRMIGIGGNPDALKGLAEIYSNGDANTKESVLHAYMISDDVDSVYALAASAVSDEEFESAVHTLGVMGATDRLRSLPDRPGASESIIHALAIAGDYEGLRAYAVDASNPERQLEAIHGLGIVGGEEVGPTLIEIYRGTDNNDVREAALHGLFVADHDTLVLELFRESTNSEEKADLLRILVMMDSDAAIEAIDAALAGGP